MLTVPDNGVLSRQWRALIIDGDEHRFSAIGPTLERHDYDVTYTSVADAVQAMYSKEFDVVIGSGRAAAALDHFRSDPGFDSTPFLMASVDAGSVEIVEGLERGADDYLLLDASDAEISARIEAHVRRSIAREAPTTTRSSQFEYELARELRRLETLRPDLGSVLAVVEIAGLNTDDPEHRLNARLRIAAEIRRHIRPIDVVSSTRQGEIVILMPFIADDLGVRRLEKVVKATSNLLVDSAAGLAITTTHIGYVRLDDDPTMEPDTAMVRAAIAATTALAQRSRKPERFRIARADRRSKGAQTPIATDEATRVLMVDDDRFTVAIVKSVLERRGVEVVTADGHSAIGALYGSRYDLILSNRSMPGLSGTDFLARVRADPSFDATPFMFMSSSSDAADIVEGLVAGADDYLVKSADGEAFFARIQTRLARSQSQRDEIDSVIAAPDVFEFQLDREALRAEIGGPGGVVAMLEVPTLDTIGMGVGPRRRREVLTNLAEAMATAAAPLDILGATRSGDLAILMPATEPDDAVERLYQMAEQAAGLSDEVNGVRIRLVPMIGFVPYSSNEKVDPDALIVRATVAAAEAAELQDLQPHPYVPARSATAAPSRQPHKWTDWIQVVVSSLMGIVAPFFIYMGLDSIGLDVTWFVYLGVVAALVFTAALIWIEGFLAGGQDGPPSEAGAPEPLASAIICAYLPNEAATIIETIERFQEVDYDAGFQIILAYNTPEPMEIEATLREMEAADPRLLVIEVPYSTSKAQNLNAALGRVTGDIVGVFDADHHPEPTVFHRAWRWLSNGYDAVQGHCLVRNADEGFLARMIAVEFESIYAVSHPGRFRRDDFGIFGGSNGYWWTDKLHLIRMRGSMLTEDIDSSMRLLGMGGKIASDPGLISRELGTTTPKQIWNQRLRWAQGWFQVSIRHVFRLLKSGQFSFRQKFGIFNLLLQRELYPWISLQIIPLVAFWFWRGDGFDWFVPIFVVTTVFTATVGFGQVIFAYRNAHPDIKVHKWWFVEYLFFTLFVYTEAKNIIARVAQLKQFMGESSWRVTPRS